MNIFLSKKGIGPVVAVALLLVVSVGAVMGFQSWFQTYQSGVNSKVEIQSNTNLGNTKIETLVGDTLYFKNSGTDNITINSVKIGGIDCNISKNISTGMKSLNVTSCLNNLTTSTPDIVVFTSQGIYQKKTYIKSVTSSTQSVSAPLPIPTNGLILEYLFDGNINDSIGTKNGVGFNDFYETGINAGSKSLIVNDFSYATIPNVNFGLSNYSISIWSKSIQARQYQYIFMQGYYTNGQNSQYISLVSNYSDNLFSFRSRLNSNTNNVLSLVSPSINVWEHIVLTKNSNNNYSLYINNHLESSNIFNFNDYYPSNNFYIGAYDGNSAPTYNLNGSIDNLRIYNRTLNLTEIQALYGEGN